jgi:hypothetical protein
VKWIALIFCLMFTAVQAGELREIKTPRDVSVRVWVQQASKTADTLVLLIPGGNGARHLKEVDGKITLSANFIARTSERYAQAGLIAVLMDAPSDSINGMSDSFRISDDHFIDIKAILDSFPVKRVFVIATSRGTLSGVALAARMANDPRLKGLVLTGSIQYKDYIETAHPEQIKSPVLIVHHRDDACDLNSFAGAQDIYDHLRVTNKNVLFVPVSEGSTPEGQDPCMPISVHGFYGADAVVTDRIIQWVTTR